MQDDGEGPAPLDADVGSIARHVRKTGNPYSSAFASGERFISPKSQAPDVAAPGQKNSFDIKEQWRPSTSFASLPRPEDTAAIISMGSQFDSQRPRFAISQTLQDRFPRCKTALHLKVKRASRAEFPIEMVKRREAFHAPPSTKAASSSAAAPGAAAPAGASGQPGQSRAKVMSRTPPASAPTLAATM